MEIRLSELREMIYRYALILERYGTMRKFAERWELNGDEETERAHEMVSELRKKIRDGMEKI